MVLQRDPNEFIWHLKNCFHFQIHFQQTISEATKRALKRQFNWNFRFETNTGHINEYSKQLKCLPLLNYTLK